MLTMPDRISRAENIQHILSREDGVEVSLHERGAHAVHDLRGAGIADIDFVRGDADDGTVELVERMDVAGAVTG